MSDEVQDSGGGDDIGVVVLMLGLYLIVLAFFILLNAISENSPDREELVVESVKEGFDFREEGSGKGSDPTDITAPPAYEAVVQSISGMLESHLEIDEYDIVGDSERVQMTLDLDRFFYKGEVRIIPDMILFFEDLAKIIEEKLDINPLQIQVMISGDESTLDENTPYDDFSLAGRRSTLFVRALVAEGIPASIISAGAYKAQPRILISFHLLQSALPNSEKLHSDMHQLSTTTSDHTNTY